MKKVYVTSLIIFLIFILSFSIVIGYKKSFKYYVNNEKIVRKFSNNDYILILSNKLDKNLYYTLYDKKNKYYEYGKYTLDKGVKLDNKKVFKIKSKKLVLDNITLTKDDQNIKVYSYHVDHKLITLTLNTDKSHEFASLYETDKMYHVDSVYISDESIELSNGIRFKKDSDTLRYGEYVLKES